jgi:CBS domain-containing protein
MTDKEENVLSKMDEGITPKLRALMIHNSTVYRWNRPCYGISPNGKPHLRIENRIFPSGPSVIDEIANAAFWIGLMKGFEDEYPDITQVMDFDDAKDNFVSAARDGLGTDFNWVNGKKISVTKLLEDELLPIARQGLKKHGIDKKDIDKYISIVENRVKSRQTGSQWIVKSYSKLLKDNSREEIATALTSCMIENQKSGKPIHEWELATLDYMQNWHPYAMLVEEFMTTDLFTVQQEDIPELVADILNWRKIKHIPVEDNKGRLKGLINYRRLLNYYSKHCHEQNRKKTIVQDLMITNPVTIHPEATVKDALMLMKEKKVDCLPVTKNDRLVGIITEGNFLSITNSLLKALEKEE